MCTICAALRPFDDECTYATIGETTDAAASTATSYSMDVGDTFNGSISPEGEEDWVRIRLTAGETYTFSLTGNSLNDPFLRLYDNNGISLGSNDDFGGFDSELTLTVNRSGNYYVSAGSYEDSRYDNVGTYSMTVVEGGEPVDPGEVFTMDEIAEQLTDGFWENDGSSRRAFDVGSDSELTVDIASMSAEYQQLARWALEAWTNVTGIEFREVTFGAEIEFQEGQFGNDAGSAYATSSVVNGVIQSSFINVGTTWQDFGEDGTTIDGYTFQTFVHEIGHALGLGHAGNYNVSATFGTDNHYANDSWQATVMSYFDQTNNTAINASYALLATTMIADIVAIQDLYGAPGNNTVQGGNTVWGANSNIDGYLGDLFGQIFGEDPTDTSIYQGRDLAFTLYDTGGRKDVLDLSPADMDQKVDLREEGISNIMGLVGNMVVARDTVIEQYKGGSGKDVVTGNDADNTFWGYDGNDRLKGGAGADTLKGGKGRDKLEGAKGRDKLDGSKGADTLDGGKGNDTLIGGAGKDIFIFTRNKSSDDTIEDFNANQDTIRIENASRSQVDVDIRNGNTFIDYGQDTIKLEGVRLSKSDIDFDFV